MGLKVGHKIRQAKQFDFVFKNTKGLNKGSCFFLRYANNSLGFSRLGIIVSKRQVSRAVDRNKVKRIVRERFRLLHSQLPSLDIVIVARGLSAEASKKRISACIDKLLLKLIIT